MERKHWVLQPIGNQRELAAEEKIRSLIFINGGNTAVAKILAQQGYCGDIINFKTYAKSFKDKTRRDNPGENWVILYRFVGYIELPEIDFQPPHRADTRKGVAVSYLTHTESG